MSVGRNLQEMENVVTKGAAPADPMSTIAQNASGVMIPGQTGSWEDLGGPTPENYRPDDDSAALKTPGATLAQVKNVVNAKAAAAEPMHTMAKEEVEEDDDLVDEEELDEDEEVVAEESSKKKKKEEKEDEDEDEDEEDEMKEEFDIEEDVNALLAGEELSEEFQEKARTIFEAAIRSKVSEIKEELQQTYENALVEEVQFIKQELTERVDAYLEYVADEWIQENALAVEHGLKTEMTESFLQGMKSLFEDHYVTIPEDRYDVIESMVDKLDEMEGKLNEQIERNVALNRRLAESVADVIFADVAEGLALSQKDKLASLAENVEFDGEANYREKLVTLRESYFPTNTGTQRGISENLSEEVSYEGTENSVSPIMEAYLQTLSRVANK
ncbi:head scaffolding protein [Synechococcus phage S-SRM01]|uniref:Prohead core scaffold protein n=1 Tax=Synechococcus phage S-SRM01 TaxID=2781608 RepID=A0A879R1W8_9CAUD|nr:head scaffolding protein [Synechococcus phage S-SRM01]QPX48182.1 prohead core scaffold protein [Synechococcus phage S-SRM01]